MKKKVEVKPKSTKQNRSVAELTRALTRNLDDPLNEETVKDISKHQISSGLNANTARSIQAMSRKHKVGTKDLDLQSDKLNSPGKIRI